MRRNERTRIRNLYVVQRSPRPSVREPRRIAKNKNKKERERDRTQTDGKSAAAIRARPGNRYDDV